MRNTVRLTLVMACALLACSIAGAEQQPTYIGSFDHASMPGSIVKFAKTTGSRDVSPGPIPTPVEPPAAMAGGSFSEGPVASIGSGGVTSGLRSAMLTPRGGTMSSPKQQADREIRKLIRRLD